MRNHGVSLCKPAEAVIMFGVCATFANYLRRKRGSVPSANAAKWLAPWTIPPVASKIKKPLCFPPTRG